MSGSEGGGIPDPRISLGFNLEQVRELGRSNAIRKLQQNYQALSNEVAQMSTDSIGILAHLRKDPGGGHRRTPATPKDDSSSSHSSSSQEEVRHRRERRPPRQPFDDLRDMKIDPPKVEGNLNPDLFIKWMEALERFFEIKGYSDEKAFKVVVLKLKKYASLWYENIKMQRAREGKPRIRTWSKLKKLVTKRFLPDNYKCDLYLRA